MMNTVTAFTIALFVNGVPVNDTDNRIGPFPDGGSCIEFQREIDTSIKDSFENQSIYGISTDMWGIAGGAIMRYQDYEIACVRETRDIETGELISEMFFY